MNFYAREENDCWRKQNLSLTQLPTFLQSIQQETLSAKMQWSIKPKHTILLIKKTVVHSKACENMHANHGVQWQTWNHKQSSIATTKSLVRFHRNMQEKMQKWAFMNERKMIVGENRI
jgi:hypothetical protein